MENESSCKLYFSAIDAWESMLADCATAEKTIFLEQYIFYPGGITGRFLDVFKEKALAGVDVRLLLDAVGSWTLMGNKTLLAELAQAGVQVRWYNKVLPLFLHRTASYFFRNHRKLLVVDGSIAHVGGLNISQQMLNWRDTHGRLVGPVVGSVRSSFLQVWNKSRQSIPHILSKGKQRFMGINDTYDFLPNSPGPKKRYVYYKIEQAMRKAQKRIWITVPYFVPNLRLFRSLQKAVRRGVDVRIILPRKSDLRALDLAAHSYFGMALRSGIQLYTYEPSVLHSKVVICDNAWATFGSMNMDSMSFNFNLEANIVTTNSVTVSELVAQFMADLSLAKSVNYNNWQHRPLLQKFLELLLWPFHFLL